MKYRLLVVALVVGQAFAAIRNSFLKVQQTLVDNNVPLHVRSDIVLSTVNDIAIYYEGCFADEPIRDMPMQYLSPTMTLQACAKGCQAMGYQYFGVQYGEQCWCGNSFGSYGPSGQRSFNDTCYMPCNGLPSAVCGGVWSNSVYSMKLIYGYQGCYQDATPPNRALPYPVWAPWDDWDNGGYQHGIVIEYCAEICATNNFLWAGLQTGYQCWCGNEIRHNRLPDSECNTDCTGATPENPQKCGGSWTNSIYQAWTKSNAYRGCWTEAPDREMTVLAYEGNNSIEKCVKACKARYHRFAGLQYGSQCWCSEVFATKGRSTACTMPCDGNPSQICGGSWANSVYSVNGSPDFAL